MTKFKPKDWILVRDKIYENWHLAQFSHFNENGKICVCGSGVYYLKGIPYEGNEELLGTTKTEESNFKFKFFDKVYVKFDKDWREGYYIYGIFDPNNYKNDLYGIAVKYDNNDEGRIVLVPKDRIAESLPE